MLANFKADCFHHLEALRKIVKRNCVIEGNTAETSQAVCLLQAINEVDMCVVGTRQIDMKAENFQAAENAEIYEAECWNQTYRMKANFAEASSPILVENEDGDYVSTPWQVADFRHNPRDAMRAIISQDDIDGDCEDEIENAVSSL